MDATRVLRAGEEQMRIHHVRNEIDQVIAPCAQAHRIRAREQGRAGHVLNGYRNVPGIGHHRRDRGSIHAKAKARITGGHARARKIHGDGRELQAVRQVGLHRHIQALAHHFTRSPDPAVAMTIGHQWKSRQEGAGRLERSAGIVQAIGSVLHSKPVRHGDLDADVGTEHSWAIDQRFEVRVLKALTLGLRSDQHNEERGEAQHQRAFGRRYWTGSRTIVLRSARLLAPAPAPGNVVLGSHRRGTTHATASGASASEEDERDGRDRFGHARGRGRADDP